MTSKVLVKLPMVPFPQEKKAPSDLVTLADRSDGLTQVRQQGMNIDRASQLEQNMKFLQEQHQATLVALHQEVETLRQRNRDLQFQLVFSKGTNCVSSPSSPEENGAGFATSKGSPGCVNITPLQIELLEKELQDIKTTLQDTKAHNQYLSEIIELQKKTLDSSKEEKEKLATLTVGIQVGNRLDPAQADLVARLEDAEAMVKRLRRENSDQKREIATLRATASNNGGTNRGGRSRDSNNSHHSHGSPTATAQEQTSHKFPPLQTQSYWHRRLPRNGRSRHDKHETQQEADASVLPQLQNGSTKSDTMIYESPFYRSRGYHNYYRDGGNRKYRGQILQRDHRDQDHRYNRRDYKDKSSKDYQREFVDSADGTRDADNSRRQ